MHCSLQKGACFHLKKHRGLSPSVGKGLATSFHSMSENPNSSGFCCFVPQQSLIPAGLLHTEVTSAPWRAQTGVGGAALPRERT